MEIGKSAGTALGMLAGTTLASGIAFLAGMGPTLLTLTVCAGGAAGTAAGYSAAFWLERSHGKLQN
ncbi:hypothetical protein [Paenibacillus sp.]|jgi:hypothetical protein|uniref:hypothetical protein n=1 Tax=Paenibacillus sp. TaxID=58172 RepID=UPI002837E5B5|nr:hypothetical protein [Paenibacillus sp.]MDR0270586.1 hypothetical protein [Paenibacillus sp.]